MANPDETRAKLREVGNKWRIYPLDYEFDAALAAHEAALIPQWQDISTAPKDGPILGYAEGVYTVVKWCGSYWSLTVCGAYAGDGEWWPTHWMPLPAPPASVEALNKP